MASRIRDMVEVPACCRAGMKRQPAEKNNPDGF